MTVRHLGCLVTHRARAHNRIACGSGAVLLGPRTGLRRVLPADLDEPDRTRICTAPRTHC
ncbi:hypothetical protein [Streptomyces sp. WMMC940]|uniref:hypothetical protein n=1 Tax=Streptomyces sp. WMMC940 TaxID=3015153 RepID=UPI0022B70A8D|nr:hypothetical protein [Streptomyces sp. WMMC940]MCZ7457997.1 hypothetical protein [Streptomyces sp. WMMC940]